MMFWLFVALVLAGCAVVWLLTVYIPRRRLARSLARPFPAPWLEVLHNQAFYRELPEALRVELREKLKAFLHDKEFVGCEGLTVTDEMRVTIGAQACLLLLNRPSTGYRDLRWIYVFPGEFRSRFPEHDEIGVVHHHETTFAGVSWENGRVVLAWDSVRKGLARDDDGFNVVLHEFAHQLDQEDGTADGAPLLYRHEEYGAWAEAFGAAYEDLCDAVEAGEHTLIDPYGATDPAEFFAVVTELFYERPRALRHAHPDLYEAMLRYYRIDPDGWRPVD